MGFSDSGISVVTLYCRFANVIAGGNWVKGARTLV